MTPKRLAEIIQELSNNGKLREVLGKKGKELVEKEYNWEIESVKLLKIYDLCMKKASRYYR
ncbi:hypothetical protein DRO55_02050 [Candidatus Bathyarchaeota archaeon]|nr:MAG: hypothetical protein DRO55_02050 [Candidatus Bathyarchaeota archaeon]